MLNLFLSVVFSEVVRTYKNKHLEDRKELQHFVQFVVRIE